MKNVLTNCVNTHKNPFSNTTVGYTDHTSSLTLRNHKVVQFRTSEKSTTIFCIFITGGLSSRYRIRKRILHLKFEFDFQLGPGCSRAGHIEFRSWTFAQARRPLAIFTFPGRVTYQPAKPDLRTTSKQQFRQYKARLAAT